MEIITTKAKDNSGFWCYYTMNGGTIYTYHIDIEPGEKTYIRRKNVWTNDSVRYYMGVFLYDKPGRYQVSLAELRFQKIFGGPNVKFINIAEEDWEPC